MRIAPKLHQGRRSSSYVSLRFENINERRIVIANLGLCFQLPDSSTWLTFAFIFDQLEFAIFGDFEAAEHLERGVGVSEEILVFAQYVGTIRMRKECQRVIVIPVSRVKHLGSSLPEHITENVTNSLRHVALHRLYFPFPPGAPLDLGLIGHCGRVNEGLQLESALSGSCSERAHCAERPIYVPRIAHWEKLLSVIESVDVQPLHAHCAVSCCSQS